MKVAIAASFFALACDGGGLDGDAGSVGDGGTYCVGDDRADTYAAGMEKLGTSFKVQLVESVPAPPARFDNTWTVRALDLSDVPVDDAKIAVTPWMPDHGHGTPVDTMVTPQGSDGIYELDSVNLWMPGMWQITLDINDGADSVVFSFCIRE